MIIMDPNFFIKIDKIVVLLKHTCITEFGISLYTIKKLLKVYFSQLLFSIN